MKKWRVVHISNNREELGHLPALHGGWVKILKYIIAQFLDEVNPAKPPYIGAMMAQGERHPARQNPVWEQLSVGLFTDTPEPQNHRGSWKVVQRLNNYASHTALAFIKKQRGPKVNKIAKDRIWVFIHRPLRDCLSQGWKLTWFYKVLSWNHFIFDLSKDAVNFHLFLNHESAEKNQHHAV